MHVLGLQHLSPVRPIGEYVLACLSFFIEHKTLVTTKLREIIKQIKKRKRQIVSGILSLHHGLLVRQGAYGCQNIDVLMLRMFFNSICYIH